MSKILVTGGCGYIGSHTVIDLIERGYEVISVDNMINSFETVLDGIEQISGKRLKNYKVDLRNESGLRDVFESEDEISGIIHFAALKSVGDSVKDPLLYFDNNVNGMINLLRAVVDYKIPHFVFSSSCTVYGQPEVIPVTEDTPLKEADSPYGRTKQICEGILKDVTRRYPFLKLVLLRYFNPAGAHESAMIGENCKDDPTNLVPIIMEVASGKREKLMVFGDDYNTRDGSCIRDYIHVMDLANAHSLALNYLENEMNQKDIEIFNLGLGDGVTVLEAIKAFESSCNAKLHYEIGPRRPGDVEKIYSINDKARKVLNWNPLKDIKEIMLSAWKWETNRIKKS